MATYLISYESDEMFHDYSIVVEKIKQLGDYQHPLVPLWFVKTELNANEIYGAIKPLLREKDRLFIMNIAKKGGKYVGWIGRRTFLIYLIHMPIAGIVSNICSKESSI